LTSDGTEQPAFPYNSVQACAVAYTLFVVYASLVPLRYQPLEWHAAVIQFRNLFSRPISFDQWADFATNILLFVPLSFFWLGSTRRRGSRRQTLWLLIIVTVCCAFLSAAIEFVQLWFPPRDSTLDDVAAETIGAVIGGGVWLLDDGAVAAVVATLITAATPHSKVQWLLFAYCVGLACLAIIPLERTFDASDLFRDFHAGKIAAVPFGYHYASATGLTCSILRDVICFTPVGAYLAGCRLRPGSTAQPFYLAVLLGGAFVTALESIQVIVYNRLFNATGLMSGATGVALGYLAMQRQLPGLRQSSATKPAISLVRLSLILACVVASCWALESFASR
jgi:glycopeptide antibiotics resistance protein